MLVFSLLVDVMVYLLCCALLCPLFLLYPSQSGKDGAQKKKPKAVAAAAAAAAATTSPAGTARAPGGPRPGQANQDAPRPGTRQRRTSEPRRVSLVDKGPVLAAEQAVLHGLSPADIAEFEMLYEAKHVIMLFKPVSLSMGFVVFSVNTIHYFTRDDGVYLSYTPFHEKEEDTTSKVWQATANALIMIGSVAVMTFLLFFLYKYECYKVLHGWMLWTSFTLLFSFSFIYLYVTLENYNIPMDFITSTFIQWNFGVLGMLSIHWKAPLLVQQAYLILISSLMALIFIKYLPDWTVWFVLGALAIWDLIAVLCPHGPLRMLVETAEERDEALMPALVYSSTMAWQVTMADNRGDDQKDRRKRSLLTSRAGQRNQAGSRDRMQSDVDDGAILAYLSRSGSGGPSDQNRNLANRPDSASARGGRGRGRAPQASGAGCSSGQRAQGQQQRGGQPVQQAPRAPPPPVDLKDLLDSMEISGPQLGLGDFVFYSVLVGKASSKGDWNITLACYVSILVGLCATLLLLAIWRKALPALPISILFGITFYIGTLTVVRPFSDKLSSEQVYI